MHAPRSPARVNGHAPAVAAADAPSSPEQPYHQTPSYAAAPTTSNTMPVAVDASPPASASDATWHLPVSSSNSPPARSAGPASSRPQAASPRAAVSPLEADQLSAAVESCDVAALVGHLYGEQSRLQGRAAVEVHAHMTRVAAELLELAAAPEQLTLTLIHSGGLSKRSGCWVDLPTLLLKALDEHRQLTTSPPVDPSLVRFASAILGSIRMSARSFALLIRVFDVPFSFDARCAAIDQRLASGDRREAADLAIRLDVLPQLSDDKHRQLLTELVAAQEVDTVHKYVEALPDSCREHWLTYAVEQTADESGADNLTAACRLIAHYGRRLTDFPQVAHMKAKHELWWACRMGKSDEFASLLLTNGDVRLQRSLVRQLSKGRYEGDIDSMYRWIAQFGLAHDADVRMIVEQVQSSPPQAQFSSSLTTETADERAVPTFSMPEDSMTFVGDEATIAQATKVLSRHTSEESLLGFDCEYLPEPYFQLGVGSSSTQLLQIACSEHTFLVDLQLLSPPAPARLTQSLVDLLLLVLSSDAAKLGIGFSDDVRRMRADFSHLACFQVTLRGYCDLQPLLTMGHGAGGEDSRAGGQGRAQRRHRRAAGRKRGKQSGVRGPPRDEDKTEDDALTSQSPPLEDEQPQQQADSASQQLQPAMPKKEGGLARLCRLYTGCRLDKTCQISNWSRRPLTREQTMYAACDAHVQLLIYAEALRRGQQLRAAEIEG